MWIVDSKDEGKGEKKIEFLINIVTLSDSYYIGMSRLTRTI